MRIFVRTVAQRARTVVYVGKHCPHSCRVVCDYRFCKRMKRSLWSTNFVHGKFDQVAQEQNVILKIPRRFLEGRDKFTTRPWSLTSTPHNSDRSASVPQLVWFLQLRPSVDRYKASRAARSAEAMVEGFCRDSEKDGSWGITDEKKWCRCGRNQHE